MAEHSEHLDGRVDYGGRLFLAWAFIPIILSLVMNAINFGQSGNLIAVTWGLLVLALLIYLANALYSGSRRAERMTAIIGGVFLLLAIGEVAMAWHSLVALHVAFQCLMPALLALMLFARPIRLFFASQRGETLPEQAKGGGVAAQRTPIILYVAGLLLIVTAACTTLIAADQMVTAGMRTTAILVGMLGIPIAAILIVFGRDWKAAAESDFADEVHRKVVAGDARSLHAWLVGVTVLIALAAVIDLM